VITAVVVTVKAGLTVAPAATVTEAGTETAALLLLKATTVPPAGAAWLSVTVLPAKDRPPTMPDPARCSVSAEPALTVRLAVCEVPPSDAVIVEVAFETTVKVETVNVAVVEPAATVTDAGTVAAEVLLDVSATVVPPVGAMLLKVTVPVELSPPVTEVGLRETPVKVGAVTVKLAVCDWPFNVAVTVAVAFAATALVATVNVPVVAPAAIVAVAGTVAPALLEANVIERPPAGAALLIVRVPVEDTPPATVVGLSATAVSVGAVMDSAALELEPFDEAVMFAVAFAPTATVVTLKVPVVAPAAIVAVAGTVAAALSEARLTLSPPVGAALLIVIVPVEPLPPTKPVGFRLTPVTFGPVTPSVAVLLEEFAIAVIVAVRSTPTTAVVILKLAVVAPAGIVTDEGTVTEAELEVRAIASPPAGAALEIVTVPVAPAPPKSEVGLTVRPVTVGAVTDKAVETLVSPTVAEMFAVALVVMPAVVTVKFPELDPAAIEIEPGTVAAALSDASVTVTPPVGATPDRVTVPAEDCPPNTVIGLSVTV